MQRASGVFGNPHPLGGWGLTSAQFLRALRKARACVKLETGVPKSQPPTVRNHYVRCHGSTKKSGAMSSLRERNLTGEQRQTYEKYNRVVHYWMPNKYAARIVFWHGGKSLWLNVAMENSRTCRTYVWLWRLRWDLDIKWESQTALQRGVNSQREQQGKKHA